MKVLKFLFVLDAGVVDMPRFFDPCYNYYRKALLPNMYGDRTFEQARERFFPFYPLVNTFCSSELEAFFCSVLLPRYDPVTYRGQKPCRATCKQVYRSCTYAIIHSKFYWPSEMKCENFNDTFCYSKYKHEKKLGYVCLRRKMSFNAAVNHIKCIFY